MTAHDSIERESFYEIASCDRHKTQYWHKCESFSDALQTAKANCLMYSNDRTVIEVDAYGIEYVLLHVHYVEKAEVVIV